MHGVSGNVLGCSFRFVLYSSLLFNKRTYISLNFACLSVWPKNFVFP